jgi:predicted Rossmann fold nucleotide-binding protein DprA/Smf involved in DNA uptake
LNTKQYSALTEWLMDRSLRPGDLLDEKGRSKLNDFISTDVARDVLVQLLDRGAALALMTERWASSGIWVIGRGDPAYPSRFKSYLQHAAPPFLFGVGVQENLQKGGVAIVGSRHASEEDLEFGRQLGKACAVRGIPVISGAAKGIDIESMMAAVDNGGISIGILAEGLGRISISAQFHDGIVDGRLMLLSPFDPDSRWFAHSAMDRNKLVYGLADAAVVVASTDGQGGTWAGATEAIRRSKIPVYVKASGSIPPGNRHLLELGARALPEDAFDKVELLSQSPPISVSLFDGRIPSAPARSNGSILEAVTGTANGSSPEATNVVRKDESRPASAGTAEATADAQGIRDAYSAVEPLLLDILNEPMDEKVIAEKLGLLSAQAKVWLKRAVKDGSVRKMSKPVRYIATAKANQSKHLPNLFGD